MRMLKQALAWFLLYYLRFWAKLAVNLHKPKIIGIAGSIGKSSTRNAVATVLSHTNPIRTIETNSETGLPLGILGIKPHDYSLYDWFVMMLRAPFGINYIHGAKYLVIEMGIDDPYPPKNMDYLLTIVSPQIGIIVYESAAHTMQFAKVLEGKSFANAQERSDALIDAITREDLKLLTNPLCETAIVNADCKPLMSYVNTITGNKPNVLTFGSFPGSTIQTLDYKVAIDRTTFRYLLEGKHTITLSFPHYCFPEEYKGTFAASLAVARLLGIPAQNAKLVLEEYFHPPQGRASIFSGISDSTILDSSYNASKPTVLACLALLKTLKKETRRPTVAILADMLELGPQEQMEHEEVARAIAGSADFVYLVGPLTKRYIYPILQKQHGLADLGWFESADKLNNFLILNLPKYAIILVKGSQGQLWLEETIKLLLNNKKDVDHLCRQNDFWQKVKKRAGRWIEVK